MRVNRLVSALCLAPSAFAIPAFAQPERPIFHTWVAEPTSGWSDPSDDFIELVRVVLSSGTSGTTAGAAAAALVHSRSLSSGKIAITIQNFGHPGYVPTFFSTADEVDMDPFVLDIDRRIHQPYMTIARGDVEEWMSDFCTAYSAYTPAQPDPAFFFFDMERPATGICSRDFVRLLLGMFNEPPQGGVDRWVETPVPGFGGDTMADL